MNQKLVSVVGVVVVLGLSLLLGDAFSGAPASESVSEPVPQESEQKQEEVDLVTGVHLRGLTARSATMNDSDGSVLPGIEYAVELELPRRFEGFVANNRLEVRAAVSGETMQYLGTKQFHANSFQLEETKPTYLVYRVHLINYHADTFDVDRLDDLVTRSSEDLRISFYVDGNKVKDF